MNEATYQCRKCREVLFVESCLANIEDTLEECQLTTQLFLEESKAPPWIRNIIEHDLFTKGKLNCPKCKGRVGAFDFVSHILCGCGQHKLPPIRVHSDRVDNIIPNLLKPLKRPMKKIHSADTFDNILSRKEVITDMSSNVIHKNDSGETSESLTRNEDLYSKNENEGENSGATCTVNHEGNFVFDNEDVESVCTLESVNQFNALGNEEAPENMENDELFEITTTVVDQDPFTCPVCLELFYLPQQCEPCKHIFCDPCLRQLNANTLYGQSVKCPLCRNVINACNMHKEYHETIKTKFPEEHISRRKIEKKNKQLIPSLPGMPVPLRRRRGNNGNNRHNNVTILAGVCFVVLATMMGFTVFAVTVGFVSWYLLEIAIELVVDLTSELSTFFELLRSILIVLCIDGTVREEHIHSLFNSSSRIILAFAKVVDSTSNRESSMSRHKDPAILQNTGNVKENMSDRSNELTKMTQATLANYVLVGGLVTYLLYRLAKYLQTVRTGR